MIWQTRRGGALLRGPHMLRVSSRIPAFRSLPRKLPPSLPLFIYSSIYSFLRFFFSLRTERVGSQSRLACFRYNPTPGENESARRGRGAGRGEARCRDLWVTSCFFFPLSLPGSSFSRMGKLRGLEAAPRKRRREWEDKMSAYDYEVNSGRFLLFQLKALECLMLRGVSEF